MLFRAAGRRGIWIICAVEIMVACMLTSLVLEAIKADGVEVELHLLDLERIKVFRSLCSVLC